MATLKKPKSGHHHRPPPQYKTGPDPLAHLPLVPLIAQWCEWLRVKQYSPDSLKARQAALRTFAAWAEERSLLDPASITKPVLDRYQHHLFYYRKANGKPLAASSQATILQSLKGFFKWAARQNHLPFNPASELELPKVPKQLPRCILSVEEVATILNETDTGSVYGLRDRAMLELLYSTGMRRKEVENLLCSDVDFKRQVVLVRGGKGGRDRVVPLGGRAIAWLQKYLDEARDDLCTAAISALFVTDFGDPVNGHYVAMRVKRYMAMAGIEREGAAHLLRHACATHMLENGADIRYIQALLGHANLNTTEIYTHVSIEKLKSIHEATHPARLVRSSGTGAAAAPAAIKNAANALFAALQAESEAEQSEAGALACATTPGVTQ